MELDVVLEWLTNNGDKVRRDFSNNNGYWTFFVPKEEIPEEVVKFVNEMNEADKEFDDRWAELDRLEKLGF